MYREIHVYMHSTVGIHTKHTEYLHTTLVPANPRLYKPPMKSIILPLEVKISKLIKESVLRTLNPKRHINHICMYLPIPQYYTIPFREFLHHSRHLELEIKLSIPCRSLLPAERKLLITKDDNDYFSTS
jgi:hypothetical protein